LIRQHACGKLGLFFVYRSITLRDQKQGASMPKLVRLYIVHSAIGFGLSAVFVAMLVGFNVAGLGRLVLGSDMGWIAAFMLVVVNGVVFAGAQFAIAVMRLAEDDTPPRGGLRQRMIPIPVFAGAAKSRRKR
jgi:hypothetical protein